MSANTPLINTAVEKLQHIEKSATAKAVKAIPLGFKALKRGQAIIIILLFGFLSYIVFQQNQNLNEVRAWKQESKNTHIVMGNWIANREQRMQKSLADNQRLQSELSQKRWLWVSKVESRLSDIQSALEDFSAKRNNDNAVIRAHAKCLYSRINSLNNLNYGMLEPESSAPQVVTFE